MELFLKMRKEFSRDLLIVLILPSSNSQICVWRPKRKYLGRLQIFNLRLGRRWFSWMHGYLRARGIGAQARGAASCAKLATHSFFCPLWLPFGTCAGMSGWGS